VLQTEALSVMIEQFVNTIRSGVRSPSDGEAGRRIVRVLEACSESIALRGKPVVITPAHGKNFAA
jgi:hypothetical protein